MDLWKDWFNFIDFIEKLYLTIINLFYRYNSNNNINIVYINHLQQYLEA